MTMISRSSKKSWPGIRVLRPFERAPCRSRAVWHRPLPNRLRPGTARRQAPRPQRHRRRLIDGAAILRSFPHPRPRPPNGLRNGNGSNRTTGNKTPEPQRRPPVRSSGHPAITAGTYREPIQSRLAGRKPVPPTAPSPFHVARHLAPSGPRSAPGHPGSEASREGSPSALAYPVGGDQTCGRRRSAAADCRAAARAGVNDPGRASFGDRDDLTGLHRGGRILLSIALLIAVALLAITGVAVWKMVASAVWIGRSWL